jgi:phosphopantetheine adenylyltransferase
MKVSIFDGPIEVLGADISKLYKRIVEELDEFRSRDLSQRAASLPITDPRRKAFYANSNDSFLKSPSTAACPSLISTLRTHDGVQQMRCVSVCRFRH